MRDVFKRNGWFKARSLTRTISKSLGTTLKDLLKFCWIGFLMPYINEVLPGAWERAEGIFKLKTIVKNKDRSTNLI